MQQTNSPRCLWYCKSTIFQANHNKPYAFLRIVVMFVKLQKYDFSSKSQLAQRYNRHRQRCLWYCKSTIFQANHNAYHPCLTLFLDVCDTAKVRFFKQITTLRTWWSTCSKMFVILQKYDFSSKSQLDNELRQVARWCLWYCKSTIFQANHNSEYKTALDVNDVCDTAKVRFFKQITTYPLSHFNVAGMFVILQKYDFSSKSQHIS